ncbi:ABC transporter ATP-binding protein [Anaeromicropila herbilytica]|uniref:ABC transporter ATP-binding protein n=1 Tax=Anaeromicropila herbilytica TaxID=2785025 RepID=A0A7R7EHI7_9FIRM|nr:ABC transporter ATP-binding protein [Anaeromicropila herbilytica]BCN28869.1 ABC transporter ATP-binding protein [Anaeromicropila herbilytica]
MSENHVVTVENLNKFYGKRQVLKDVSFYIDKNEIVGFIGPNGAGKSTTMKCMCNLIFPDSGTIRICGYDILKERDKALSCQAALIESPGLYMDMSGKENIKLIAKMRKVPDARVNELIEFTGLDKKINLKVGKYSMGMKQRLGLAIALLSKPRFIILDEPTNGLDPTGIIDLRNTLHNLVKEEKLSILFSSHQLGEIEKLANRIICINNGRIIDTPQALDGSMHYILQLSDAVKAKNIFAKRIKEDKIELIGSDSIKVIIDDQPVLSQSLKEILDEDITLLDINKMELDIESIYKEVYGDHHE